MKPADNVIPLKPMKRSRAELAFLPAALEIADTPPSPVGRAIVWSVVAVFSLALLWACLGKVDIVATAPGKIIPTGRTKTIQPYETGVVRAIYVKDGETVAAGDRPHRSRFHHQRRRAEPLQGRSAGGRTRHRAAQGRACRAGRSALRLRAARWREPWPSCRPAPIIS